MPQPVLATRPDPSWRSIQFPWTSRDFGFQHDSEKHRYIFRDQQLIESLGRQNPSYRYTIPFYDSIRIHGSSALFSQVYPRFLDACLDRSPGPLVDVIHGKVTAKLMSLQETLEVSRLDGGSVIAEFVYAPEDEDSKVSNFSEVAKTLPRLEEQTIRFGQKARALTDNQKKYIRDFQVESRRADVGLLGSIRATVSSVSRARDRVYAQVASAANQLEYVRQDIEYALDPQLEPLRRDAGRLTLGALEAINPPGNIRTITVREPIGRLAFAVKYGVSVEDLIDLNPALSTLITIPAGMNVRVPVAV